MNGVRKKLLIIVVSVVCLSTVFATQYARADIGYSYDLVHPSDSDIRYIASDNSSDGHRVLRANGANNSVTLEFGNWSANTNVTHSAAFGIVNEEAFCVKITDITVATTGTQADYMQVWLHSNEDTKATSEAAGDAVFMWDEGVDPNDNFWVFGAGNQDSSDADFGSTPWDSDDGVRYATGTSGASNGSDDFVWVQISIVIPGNPDSLSEHTGTITIDFEETVCPAQLQELWVDDDYYPSGHNDGRIWGVNAFSSIQDGINAVDVGGTVRVKEGIYDTTNETFPIHVNKTVTLSGPKTNIDPRPINGGRTGDEALIDGKETVGNYMMLIEADDVEINGFTITGGAEDMIRQDAYHSGTMIRYNIFYDDLSTSGDEAVQLAYCTDNGIIEYNYAYNIKEDGFNLAYSTNSIIQHNEVNNSQSENGAIYSYESTNITIFDNLVRNCNSSSNGILIYHQYGPCIIAGNKVYNNTFTGKKHPSYYVAGIAIYKPYNSNLLTITNNIIENNTGNGVRIRGDSYAESISVNNNTIENNSGWGVQTFDNLADANATLHIKYNNILNNLQGGACNTDSNYWLNAEYNYWGPGGSGQPGVGGNNGVSGNVDYTPWLNTKI